MTPFETRFIEDMKLVGPSAVSVAQRLFCFLQIFHDGSS